MPHAWLERWMEAHSRNGNIEEMCAQARARSARFPFPVNHAYPWLEHVADRFGPLLATGNPRPAHALSPEAFDAFEQGIQHHSLPLVRALYMLLRQPALEQVYPDVAPPSPSHPLDELARTIRARRTHRDHEFDVLVIGSGAGGAPAADVLASRGHKVAVIEAGGRVPTESAPDALEKHYLNQAMVGAASPRGMVLVMAGEAVGGTTVINSGTSFRPRPERVAEWSAAAGADLQKALDPFLDLAEKRIGVTVPPRELMDPSSKIVERGFAAIGRPDTFILPRNAEHCEGSARCCFGCPTGAKSSTDRAFLPNAIRNGATLLERTRATQILETPNGIEVLVHGPDGRRVLRARHLVIAAGALSTPHLVRSNRLGDRYQECGDHLKVHPATKLFALMPEPLPHGGVPQGLGYRPPELPHVTFEGIHTPASAASVLLPVAGEKHRWYMDRYEHLASYGLMVRDRNTGSVRGTGIARHIAYELHPEDAKDMGRGMLLAAEAMFAAGAQRVLLPLGKNAEVESVDALRQRSPDEFRPDNVLTSGFHPQGTAGIGRVVDLDLKLSGSDRIWIGDASVLPDSPGVNPQVTIMAFSLRLGDHLATVLEA